MTDRIELISKVAQSAAVILGIGFASYELVLKDRDQERQLVELTLKQVEQGQATSVQEARKRLFELKDLAYATPVDGPNDEATKDHQMRMDVSNRFDDETRELAHFYNVVTRCYESGYCIPDLAQALLCEDAERDLSAIQEIQGRIGNKFFGPRFFTGLASLQRSCKGQSPIEVSFSTKTVR